MDSRTALITFEELVRNTNPDLEFDINMNTDSIFTFISMAQKLYISDNFLAGDNIQENINAIRRRSDILRQIIKRTTSTSVHIIQTDNGYSAVISASDYWMFLSGIMSHSGLPTNNKGSDKTIIELDLINHYDLQKKVRTINNEPVYKYIPIVLEGSNGFVFYLDKDQITGIGGANVNDIVFSIIYLAEPPDITLSQGFSLPDSTHYDIIKRSVEMFIVDYKYKLGIDTTKQNG